MPWCRCQPYICGIITGFVLHRMRGKPLRIHWALNLTLWVVAFATGFACIYGLDSWHIALTGVAPPAFNNAMYGVFQRLGWGAALSWLIFACAKGYGGMAQGVDYIHRRQGVACSSLSRAEFTFYYTSDLQVPAQSIGLAHF